MKLLCVGDYIRDSYKWCKATRVCPEAPALVLVRQDEEDKKGGAGLVAENLVSLVGEDAVVELYGSSSTKTRLFADRTLVCRIDEDSQMVEDPSVYADAIEKAVAGCDAVVVSDYNKGAMSEEVVATLLAAAECPVFVDAKDGIAKYKGCFAIFPNEDEHRDIIEGAGQMFRHVIRKLGPRGCRVDGKLVPTVPQQVYDVTGAGDCFIAAFVAAYLNQRIGKFDDVPEHLVMCAEQANVAAGISVRHLGTYVVKPEEIREERRVGA